MGKQPGRAHRGLLDNQLTDEPEYVRFTQLQARIARSLDGNLEARKGGLDREQFGKEVLNQEDDRLMLPTLLAESLALLSAALPGNSDFYQSANSQKQQRLFLVPIDDVDLNPERCLELLRLLRHYSVPQFFFLLMGQRDLVESIVKLKIGSEFSSVADPQSPLSAVSPDELRKELGQIAAANVQKQIPSVVELPPIDLNSVLEFKPLLGSIAGDPDKLPTLGELLAQVELSDPGVPIKNLRELLQLGANQSFGPQTAGSFRRDQYPGLGAFEVAPRRLVDLWRWLSEAIHATPVAQTSSNERFLNVFMRYWHHVVDDDPQLKREDRKTLQREGTIACEVIASDPSETFAEHKIDGAELSKRSRLSNYRPVLRISLATSGSGVPRVKLKGRGGVEIEEPRTRCAFVLMHDLQRLLIDDDSNRVAKQPVTATSPVSLSWVSDSSDVRWPLPPVQLSPAKHISSLLLHPGSQMFLARELKNRSRFLKRNY